MIWVRKTILMVFLSAAKVQAAGQMPFQGKPGKLAKGSIAVIFFSATALKLLHLGTVVPLWRADLLPLPPDFKGEKYQCRRKGNQGPVTALCRGVELETDSSGIERPTLPNHVYIGWAQNTNFFDEAAMRRQVERGSHVYWAVYSLGSFATFWVVAMGYQFLAASDQFIEQAVAFLAMHVRVDEHISVVSAATWSGAASVLAYLLSCMGGPAVAVIVASSVAALSGSRMFPVTTARAQHLTCEPIKWFIDQTKPSLQGFILPGVWVGGQLVSLALAQLAARLSNFVDFLGRGIYQDPVTLLFQPLGHP